MTVNPYDEKPQVQRRVEANATHIAGQTKEAVGNFIGSDALKTAGAKQKLDAELEFQELDRLKEASKNYQDGHERGLDEANQRSIDEEDNVSKWVRDKTSQSSLEPIQYE